jgi:hypothetical protein
MRFTWILSPLVALSALTGCNEEPGRLALDGGGLACDVCMGGVEVIVASPALPERLRVRFDDRVVMDECDPAPAGMRYDDRIYVFTEPGASTLKVSVERLDPSCPADGGGACTLVSHPAALSPADPDPMDCFCRSRSVEVGEQLNLDPPPTPWCG